MVVFLLSLRHVLASSGTFALEYGSCTLNADATCFYSPNYPYQYGTNQTCKISVQQEARLQVKRFSLDPHSEFSIELWDDTSDGDGGRDYFNSNGPDGRYVDPLNYITWTSGSYAKDCGFEICAVVPGVI